MRKLFLHMMVSLDGYIAGPDNELDWHFIDKEFEEYSNIMLRSIDAILIGRNVYQIFSDYWPQAELNPAGAADPADPSRHIEAARLLNDLPKYVISTTLEDPVWNNTNIIRVNIHDEIRKLKNAQGKDIVLFGGATLASSMMELNLIDEYRLVLNPVLLGGGTPLFREKIKKTNLQLLKVSRFRSGALATIYRPEGKE